MCNSILLNFLHCEFFSYKLKFLITIINIKSFCVFLFMDWRTEFYEARWHLDVAKRMLKSYDEYSEKRILVGVIREAAKAVGNLVRAFLIRERVKGNLDTFVGEVGPKFLDVVMIGELVKMLEIERDQRKSRVEFTKGNKILMEVGGRWKILEVVRLKEIIKVIGDVVSGF